MTTKERPILFSAPMVRALLDGSKTQTRKAAKVEYTMGRDSILAPHKGSKYAAIYLLPENALDAAACCPYGQPGDRILVRETYFAFGRWETRFNDKKGRDEWSFVDITQECGRQYGYPATGLRGVAHKRDSGITPTWWERPSIFRLCGLMC